jgi:hypothetical protein
MGEKVDARCLPSATTTWLTPRHILDALGEFDLDPCCPPEMPWRTAKRMIQQPEDGLAAKWEGRVWMNPPYGRGITDWMRKLAGHGSGIALVFARTDTRWFQEWVFPYGDGILFLDKRVRFCLPDGTLSGTPAAPSVLVGYGHRDADTLKKCGLKGTWLSL